MSDEEVISEVIKYYDNYDYPFSYTLLGHLDARTEISREWFNLFLAYRNGEFTPADCRFMFDF